MRDHRLTGSSWNSWDSTSVKNVEVLCKRQRALTDVEVLHLDEKLSDDVIKRLSFDDVVTDNIERLYCQSLLPTLVSVSIANRAAQCI